MLLEKILWILAFTLVSLSSEVYGLEWPWHWKKDDVTHVKCYTTCLAAVRTGAVVATTLAIPAAGFGAAGIVAGPFAAMFMPMVAPFAARDWIAFLQSGGVNGVSPFCAAICGSPEERQCLDWPCHWKKEDVTHVKCYTTCLAAVATPLAISAAGFGAAGIVAGPIAARFRPMVEQFAARYWFAFLQSAGVYGVGTTDKMVLASTVSPLCAAICGSSEEKQELKCYTHKINGMKGLDEYLIRAERVKTIEQCEDQCNDDAACRAFRYLPRNSVCFLYKQQQYIEDDINESQFYVKRCCLCYMNATKNAKGRDDEFQTVWEASSLKECEIQCIKTDDCGAVHFDGLRCFKFNTKTEPNENTGTDFSSKICVEFNDEYDDDKYMQNGKS